MSSQFRAISIFVCLALVAGLIGIGRMQSPGVDQDASAAAPLDCRRCHEAVRREWENSAHARSWTNPQVQGAFQHFGHDRNCESCHAPQPLFTMPAQSPVLLRAEHRETGVDCLTCHLLPDNRGVAARRTLGESQAPCRPQATPSLTDSSACAACHVAIYKDWTESRYAGEKKTCQVCHMRSEPGSGVSHICLGGHDDATVRSGAKLACRQEGAELVVAVTNHATGHNFPGERHNRILLVQVIERLPSGEIALARQQLIKGITPFRGESSAEQIRAGDTFEARFPVVDPPVAAEVRLLYKRFPWHPDREALVVHETSLDLHP